MIYFHFRNVNFVKYKFIFLGKQNLRTYEIWHAYFGGFSTLTDVSEWFILVLIFVFQSPVFNRPKAVTGPYKINQQDALFTINLF